MTSEFNNGSLKLIENLGVGSESITLQVPSLSSSYTLSLPDNIGFSDQFLSTGSTPGTMEWISLARSWKEKVKLCSIGTNVVLSPAPSTLDSVSVNNEDRILLKDQSTSSENGIYRKDTTLGDLVRTRDALSSLEASGILVYVTDGTLNKDKIFYCTDSNGATFDSGITIKEFNITNVMGGPNIVTNNAIARYDGTSGVILKNSNVLVDNSGNIIGQTGNLIFELGDILFNSTSKQEIIHIGASGQNLVISSVNGNVDIDGVQLKDKSLIFVETGGGSDTITLKAPSNVTPNSYTLIFPDNIGNSNQILSTGSTPGTMEWIDQSTGGPPGGSTNDVQYNAGGGLFGGSTNFVWNNATQALTIIGSISNVTTIGMSSDLTNSGGDIILSSTSAQNITHTGQSGQDLTISSGGNVVVDTVTFNNGAVSNISTLGMSSDLTNSGGDIILSSTSAQNITHTGQSGQDLTISSGGNVIVDTVTFNNGAVSNISTLGMSSDLTNSGGDIILSSTSAQNITHTGQSGQDLTISSGGNVIVDTATFNNGAVSNISTLGMSSDLTNSGGDIILSSTSAQNITHTGQSGQDLTISSGGNVIVENVTFNNDAVSNISTLGMSSDLTNSGGDIILSSTSAQNITHTGQSGQDLTISSGGNVIVENVTINNGSISDVTNLSMSGNLTLSSTGTQNITHTGGLGDLTFSSGNNIIMESVTFNNGATSGITTLDMTGNLTISTNNIILSSSSAQNITHTGGSGQDLTISSGGNVVVENVTFNNGNITAQGFIRSNTSVILEDPGIGTNTITIQAGTPDSSYVVNLPPNNGSVDQLLQTDGVGQTNWVDNPSQPGNPDMSIQYNDTGNFAGSSDLLWNDTDKQITVNGKLVLNLATDSGTPGLSGSILEIQSQTFTDNSGGPTTSFAVFNSFSQPTLEATVATTTTNAATVYIAGSPLEGTNQTITNEYSLWVDSGNVKFDDKLLIDGNVESQATVQGVSLTDGTITINSGNITGVGNLSATTVNVTSITDGTATLTTGTLSGLVAPASDNEAANKGYVDALAQGVKWKDSVKLTTEGLNDNKTLSGEQTVDGVAAVTGDRVLIKDQWVPKQNGIWVVSTGAWSRSSDLAEGDAAAGTSVLVEQGNTFTGAGFLCNNTSGSDTVGNDAGTTGDDLSFVQFTGAGAIIAGDGMDKTGNTISVNVDNTTIEIISDTLQIKDNGISSSKIQNNSITTNKIQNSAVTNAKLANSSITVTAGDGLQNGGSVSLGGTIVLDVDNTILRTTGNWSTSGVFSFTNTTVSTNTSTGAVVISGGLGVAGNIYSGGNITTSGILTGNTSVSDGTATLTSGNFTGLGSISSASLTASGTVQGVTLTDGIASINAGSFSNVINITASGSLTTSSLTDGTAVLDNGTLSGLVAPTVASDAANKSYVDSVVVTAGDAIEKVGNDLNVKVDNATIEINSDQLRVKDSSITASKLGTDSVITSKIQNSAVTNAKLANSSITVTAGDGLQNGGSVSLGGSITLDIDNTVLKTSGDQSASGIQTFSNTTDSTNTTTGSVIISGGLGIAKKMNIGTDLTVSGTITGNTITDGTATITSGNLSSIGTIGAASLTATGTVQGVSLTDGTATMTLGSLSGISDISASGTITANSISDGTATLTDGKLTGLVIPSSDTDATNKAYVDGLAFGIKWKLPVRAATTGSNIALSGLQTIDTVSLLADERVLVKDQTNKVNNGIYDVKATSWVRSSDMFSGSAENNACLVEEGDVNIGTSFVITDTSPYTINTSELIWNQFASSGAVNAGSALEKVGTTMNVKVDDATIEVATNQLQVKNTSISTSKLANGAITTVKIGDSQVTNTKLSNSAVTITAGDGLQNGGSVSLGSSVTLDINSTVLRDNGNQSTSGIFSFTDITQSTNTTSGSIILSGGMGVAKNVFIGGLLDVSGSISGTTLTDGTSTWTSGNLSGLGSIGAASLTASGTVQGVTLTDGIATITLGDITGVNNFTATGAITGGSLTDGTATLTGGILSGLVTPTASSHATNKAYVDGLVVTAGSGSALIKTGTEFFVNVDNSSIEISLNNLQIKNSGVTTAKINDGAVTTAKIGDSQVTNLKLANSSVTITAGDGLSTGGSVSLGGSVILDVDNTVLRTSGNQSSSGIISFTNTTQSTVFTDGAVIISGGLGIAKDTFSTGRIETNNTIQGSTLTDGILSINSGDITSASDINSVNVTATTQVQGGTVTDGTASLNAGSFTGLVNVSATGTITISAIPDDRVLFTDNSGQISSNAGLTWDGSTLAATKVETQDITRPNGANQSSLWTTGTGNIDFGLQTVGTIQMGAGPMFKLTSTTSVLQSSLTIQGNLSRKYTDTTINTASNVTYTAQEVFNGIIFRNCNGASRSDIFPTAAALVAIVPEPVVGSSIEVLVRNTTTVGLHLLTLTANTGVTLNETLTIAKGITNRFLIVFNNVTGGTEAVTVFASVPKDRVILQCSFTDPTQGGNSTRYAQWGPDVGNTGLVDSTVLGFSGKIVQVVASYSNNTPIDTSGTKNLSFSVGSANATLTTFTPFTGGTNVVVWNNTVNGTYPSTSSGSLSIPVTSTNRIALRSQETGAVSPQAFQVRCAITFQLD